jgi:glyoxylase-like metal-dependent hydrolase (beta-lactamase superfamily II)
MWIKKPGKVTDHIEYLGTEDMCTYLLKGREYMLIEGGMSYVVPTILQQLDEREIDPERITKFLILHSHFDHCGAVPILQRRFPWMKGVASHRAKELFAKKKVVDFIRERNWEAVKAHGMEDVARRKELDFHDLQVDLSVGEGDIIDLGDGVSAEIIEVPGHSTCSVAAFTQPDQALFASDAGGIPNHEGTIYPSGNEDFILYQRSLEKMRGYPVKVHCAARFGAYTGQEGDTYMDRSIKSAEDYRLRAIDMVTKLGDVDKAVNALFKEHLDKSDTSDVPPEIMKALTVKMVKVIMEDYKKRSGV